MDLRRLRPAEWLLTAAAVVMIVDLFLPWYDYQDGIFCSRSGGCVGGETLTVSAWQAFSVVDVILFLCALTALLAVAFQATQRSPALPIVSDVAATWAGFIATVFVVIKLIDAPALHLGGQSADILSVTYGAWIGLVGALGIAAAGWMAMHDERVTGAHAPHLESSG